MTSVHPERDTGAVQGKGHQKKQQEGVTCKLRGDLITTNQTGT